MRMYVSNDTTAEIVLNTADTLMALGKWEKAETVIRTYCTDNADLTLRLAQLRWRKDCAEYASTLDLDALGEDGVKQALANNYDVFVADWVINEYKG